MYHDTTPSESLLTAASEYNNNAKLSIENSYISDMSQSDDNKTIFVPHYPSAFCSNHTSCYDHLVSENIHGFDLQETINIRRPHDNNLLSEKNGNIDQFMILSIVFQYL